MNSGMFARFRESEWLSWIYLGADRLKMMTNRIPQLKKRLPRIVAAPLRFFVRRSETIFGLVYRKVESQAVESARMKAPPSVNPMVDQVVEDLRDRGIAFWPGFISDPDFLEEARCFVSESADRADQMSTLSGKATYVDKERRFRYRGDIADVWLPEFGMRSRARKRAFWPLKGFADISERCEHDVFRQVMEDSRTCEVVERYLGWPVDKYRCAAEKLDRSFEDQQWHMDQYHEGVKAMILLNDVTMRQGPLRFKAGSHVSTMPGKLRALYDFYRGGDIHSAPPRPLVENVMDGPVVYGTGRAGDCIFFDTVGVHAGMRCVEGNRINMVLIFDTSSPRRRLWSALQVAE